MRFTTRNLICQAVMLATLFAAAVGSASEGGGEAPKEGGGEAPKEGEAAKEGAPAGGGADREWAKRQSKLNVHETKIKDLTKTIQHLIAMKNSNHAALDDKGKPIDVLEEIAKSHHQLQETVKEYNKEKAEMTYRYPEEGVLLERRYVPMRVQSLEQIQREMGLDGDLLRTKKKIDKKYSTFVGDELVKPPPQSQSQPESTLKETKKSGEEPQRLKLSQ